jgi:hypothetical protein
MVYSHFQLKRSVSLLPGCFLIASAAIICGASPGYSQNLIGAATCDNENDGATLNATAATPYPFLYFVNVDINSTFYPEGVGRPLFNFPIGLTRVLVGRVITRAGAQQGVAISGRYEYGGISPVGGLVLGPGILNASVGCFPAPNPENVGDGSGGFGDGDFGGRCDDRILCCSCIGADYGAKEDLFAQGTVNPDPVQSATVVETNADSENLLALGAWQGTTWAGQDTK